MIKKLLLSFCCLSVSILINRCIAYTRTNYNSGYGSSYNNNYNAGYATNYNNGYTNNYGTNYNNGYGNNYNKGYGTNYNIGYGKGYGTNYNAGTRYGQQYAQNFYQTFPYFFLDPFGMGFGGHQSPLSGFGLPWSPFGLNLMTLGQHPGYYPNGYNNNLYGIHPAFRYNGHYSVYQNYGYGNRFPMYHPYQQHPFGGPAPFFLQRRPSLGERILNSPLLPAALIAAPLLLLAKGK